jgi:DNA-binding Lrp family transcriptional regulator
MVRAYVLIQTRMGRSTDVAGEIAGIRGVTSAVAVVGPYDVIVEAEADDLDGLGRLVAAGIQTAEGVTRTITCPVIRI